MGTDVCKVTGRTISGEGLQVHLANYDGRLNDYEGVCSIGREGKKFREVKPAQYITKAYPNNKPQEGAVVWFCRPKDYFDDVNDPGIALGFLKKVGRKWTLVERRYEDILKRWVSCEGGVYHEEKGVAA